MVEPVETTDMAELSEFLARIFHTKAPGAQFLEWKYLRRRGEWIGSRSYVMRKNGHIVAHCGICPASFRLSSGDVTQSITFTDWAADPSSPGVGAALLRSLMKMSDTSFVIGGSTATRRILPKIGFRAEGSAPTYGRWVRPWKEFIVRPLVPRSALRLLHGLAHSARSRTHPSDWDTVSVNEFDSSLQPILDTPPQSFARCQRTVEGLNHLLQCPTVKMRGFLLRSKGNARGYFVLGKAIWEGRIVDVWVDSKDPNDWELAYAAATCTAMDEPEICRIRVMATVPLMSGALTENGYWLQYKEPIMIYDPDNRLVTTLSIDVQLFDGDAAYSTLDTTQ